ncbi:MAG: hypothetical protein NVS2B7_17080 [Herpetosiphon sp.]
MDARLQKTVLFYGDELIGVQEPGSGNIFVPLKRLCDNLGIQQQRQAQRIRDHEVLRRGFTTLPIDTAGNVQDAQCLRLDLIPLWLAGINANRVAPEIREKLVRYQAEAASVLWAAFRHDILPPADALAPSTGASGAAVAYEIATAIQHLARQQMELEQRLDSRLDGMARWAKQFGQMVDDRLLTLELQVLPQTTISESQAAELALAVKAVGLVLVERGIRAGYGQVYSELYRRYSVSSYKHLPQVQYQEVLAWLHDWHTELVGSSDKKST